ncbi:hypothetical protein Zmor_016889 [Zophobas morio]|uniref:Uncharacterized protein n=1 Tax=Zophobas morio TaxID=2755281 RepID=A0AA38MBD2_9CUCU|nr:hypothetical protein Zmor_016889 [Zophobas morio]
MIPDLYDYFNQPWAAALYHRNFPKVWEDVYEILVNGETVEGVKLIDEVRKRLEENEWKPVGVPPVPSLLSHLILVGFQLTKMQADEIEEICRDSHLIPVIEKKILSFLHKSYIYLPMYTHQLLLVRWILHQIKTSPLFVKTMYDVKKERQPTSIF